MIKVNSFFIATGSNLGNRLENLKNAEIELCKRFQIIDKSRIYESAAVDYLNQPDFYNQVLEFSLTSENPLAIMDFLLDLELKLGRVREFDKGPRKIDLDLLFWGDLEINSKNLILPHPRLFDRSFVVIPLSELKGFSYLKEKYLFDLSFSDPAKPIKL